MATVPAAGIPKLNDVIQAIPAKSTKASIHLSICSPRWAASCAPIIKIGKHRLPVHPFVAGLPSKSRHLVGCNCNVYTVSTLEVLPGGGVEKYVP